ncbi:hypothetical protein NC652_029717 [Populus alba x Populus x berolinensis]|nr:hypothetical protein NC652_029717 [Populus alba x Populus x berolinensis]
MYCGHVYFAAQIDCGNKKQLGFFELEFAKQITIFAFQNHPTNMDSLCLFYSPVRLFHLHGLSQIGESLRSLPWVLGTSTTQKLHKRHKYNGILSADPD